MVPGAAQLAFVPPPQMQLAAKREKLPEHLLHMIGTLRHTTMVWARGIAALGRSGEVTAHECCFIARWVSSLQSQAALP